MTRSSSAYIKREGMLERTEELRGEAGKHQCSTAAAMNGAGHDDGGGGGRDGHEHDVVMPGFRFHPTEEELLEFYLRRKVEGKRFNVELIAYLDLYRYDPWELPAFATIGEKEWFFYVPRDRKYRNGDRPNRVTTSGYWKATGADRIVRGEGLRPIGLKKTLVFYSGKAPKGVRTGWIMNEYRLPHIDTDRSLQKVEISLCRVYKRAGVEDRYHLSGTLPSRPSSSRGLGSAKKRNQVMANLQNLTSDPSSSNMEKLQGTGASISTNAVLTPAPFLPKLEAYSTTDHVAASLSSTTTEEDAASLQQPKDMGDLIPTCRFLSSLSSSMPAATVNELNKMVGFQQSYVAQANQLFPLLSQPQHPITSLPTSLTAKKPSKILQGPVSTPNWALPPCLLVKPRSPI
ncbi:hypothetical protein Taro_008583 [Colocasia esculenta]|uniref:NAC domain-containing protein n=1 Tax=Colocasia esculenta TaxID=4460 RepID=A0A843U3T4_COLES|nr:hypothetical protein [Colocasia esculenta]